MTQPFRPLVGPALLLGIAVAGTLGAVGGGPPGSVLQHHNSATRDGVYIDPALTRAAAARLHRDTTFRVVLAGPTYAQPLFWASAGPGDRDLLLAVTEQNRVYAVDASTGAVVWERVVGTPVPQRALPCGNIDPLGITGTPTVFLAAMTTPDGGRTKQHLILALSLADGTTRPGWPVDVSATVRAG